MNVLNSLKNLQLPTNTYHVRQSIDVSAAFKPEGKPRNNPIASMSITVFILSLLVAVSTATCPSRCTCTKQILNCTNAGLHRIPNLTQLYPFQPLVVDLSFNRILSVRSDDFGYLETQKLRNLYLNDNQILDVHELAFRYLTSVTEISLARNQLEEVPAMMVANCGNLFLLDLSGNYFTVSTPQLYSGSLEVLDLSSSKVKRFTGEHVKYLKSLKILSLRSNNLKELDVGVFDGLDLHYVDVGLNIWECGNSTVELFDFLTRKNLTVVDEDEPVKCLANDKSFHVIYNSKGSVRIDSEDLPLNSEPISVINEAFDYDRMVEDEADLDYSYEYADEDRNVEFFNPKTLLDSEESESDEDDVLLPLIPKNKIYNENFEEEATEQSIPITRGAYYETNKLQDFNFDDNLFIFLGLLGFAATLLTGILLGFVLIKRRVSKRGIDDSNSTAKLVLLE